MSASDIMRWGGLSAIVGGALLVIAALWSLIFEVPGGGPESFSEAAVTSSFAITTGMSLLAAVLILLGLVGLNLRQAEAAGALGRVGFLVAFLGTALVVGASWTTFFVTPSLALDAPELLDAVEEAGSLDIGFIVSFSVLSGGWALFGVSALKAQTYPRWAAIVLILAALMGFLPFTGAASPLVFGVAVALLGFFSLSGADISAAEPSRVR